VLQEDTTDLKGRFDNAPYKPVGIYNHLDIKIKVHPTLKSDLFGAANSTKIDIPLVTIGTNLTVDTPSQELRIVGFEVTPMSIDKNEGCNFKSSAGPAVLIPDQAIYFSYRITIENSSDTWPNRLDHFLNFGSQRLFWEQLVASLTVLVLATFIFGCVISSALNKDNEMIKFMRTQYRTSRFNTARSSFLRSGQNYEPVGQ